MITFKQFIAESETIKLSHVSEKVKSFIQMINAKYPRSPLNPSQRAIVWGEGEDQQFILFELEPSMSKKDAIEVKWIQAYPLRKGVGSRGLKEIQDKAKEAGLSLTLYPWDKGRVSQAALMKFYRKHGFKPSSKGSKNMVWDPEA
jgi:hypothetical protein